MFKVEKIKALINEKWEGFKRDPFSLKQRASHKALNEAEQNHAAEKFENFKKNHVTPTDEDYAVIPEEASSLEGFIRNYKKVTDKVFDDFNDAPLKGKVIKAVLFTAWVGLSASVSPFLTAALIGLGPALPAAVNNYGASSKETMRNRLYRKQGEFVEKVQSHKAFKNEFSQRLGDLKSEFTRTIAQAHNHYEALSETRELTPSQKQAFTQVKSFILSQGIDVAEAAVLPKVDITPVAKPNLTYTKLDFEAERLIKKANEAEKLLRKFQQSRDKVEVADKTDGMKVLDRGFISGEKAIKAATAIEELGTLYTEWDQKALINEAHLYGESLDRERSVETLIPSAKQAQTDVENMLIKRGDEVFEAAYLLGRMKKYPSISRDSLGDIDAAEKNPASIAQKFVSGASVKVNALLSDTTSSGLNSKSENAPVGIEDRAQAFVQRTYKFAA